jgi:hypothetical protein
MGAEGVQKVRRGIDMIKRVAWGGWRGCLSYDNPCQPPVANPLPTTLYALLSVYAIGCRFRKVAPGGPF